MSSLGLKSIENDPHLIIPTGKIRSLAYLPNGRIVTEDGKTGMDIWNLTSKQKEGLMKVQNISNFAAARNSQTVVSCDKKGGVKVWDANSCRLIKEWTHPDEDLIVAISPDDRMLAVGRLEVHVHVMGGEWQIKRIINISRSDPFKNLYCMAFSPDGSRLACSINDAIQICNTMQGATLSLLKGHTEVVRAVIWSCDGSRLFSGSRDKTVRCWDPKKGKQVGRPWIGHTDWILSLSLSPDGSTLASVSYNTILFWDTASSGNPVGKPLQHDAKVYCASFSPSGDFLASLPEYEGVIYIWQAPRSSCDTNGDQPQPHGLLSALKGWKNVFVDTSNNDSRPYQVFSTGKIEWLAYLSEGRIVTSDRFTVDIWDLKSGKKEDSIEAPDARSLAVTNNGWWVIICCQMGEVKVWNTKSYRVREWAHPENGPRVAISANNRFFAIGLQDVHIYDIEGRWKVKQSIKIDKGRFLDMAFSPDGSRLACSIQDDIWIYDVAKGTLLLGPLIGHTKSVLTLLWSHDGDRLFSGSRDMMIRCWNAKTGGQIGKPWMDHTEKVVSLSLSPDGSILASSSMDSMIRFWDTATGDPIGSPLRHNAEVRCVSFSPSGKFVASLPHENGTMCLWQVPRHKPGGSRIRSVSERPSLETIYPRTLHDNLGPSSALEPVMKYVADNGHPSEQPLSGPPLAGTSSPTPRDLTECIPETDRYHFSSGSFGDVFKCSCQVDGAKMQVAVKALRFHLRTDKERLEKMLHRELGIWKRLDHNNVVPFLGVAYGFGMSGTMSLVSLWMPNHSLYDLLRKYNDYLEIQYRLQLLLDVANGLQYLHSFRIAHGDLHTSNILLDEHYTARLVDFGFSSLIGNIPEGLNYLQKSTIRPGALRWTAPEQVQLEDVKNLTIKSDIYSFGCVALQVLSGKPPWSEVRNDVAIISRLVMGHKPGRPESRTLLDPHWNFITECWSHVEERPVAGAMVVSLQQFSTLYPQSRPLRELISLWTSKEDKWDGPSSARTDPMSSGRDYYTALEDLL